MANGLRSTDLVPGGLVVDCVTRSGEITELTVRSSQPYNYCPGCGARSISVHSQYLRRLADLPLSGHAVRLVLRARRFRCREAQWGRRICAERFENVLRDNQGENSATI